MKRNSLRDQQLFDCKKQHEVDDVVAHYPGYESIVRTLISQGCRSGAMQYYTHQDVRCYVQRHLGLEDL